MSFHTRIHMLVEGNKLRFPRVSVTMALPRGVVVDGEVPYVCWLCPGFYVFFKDVQVSWVAKKVREIKASLTSSDESENVFFLQMLVTVIHSSIVHSTCVCVYDSLL